MKKAINAMFGVMLCVIPAMQVVAADSLTVASPNRAVRFNISIGDKGEVTYNITFKQQTVIQPSVLGIEAWSKNLSLRAVESSQKDTIWKPLYGERNQIRDNYHAKTFTFQKGGGQLLKIEVRAYDAGIAFRYCFPENPAGGADMVINKEHTTFTFPDSTRAWFTSQAQGHYQLLPLGQWSSEAERPLTLQLTNGLMVALAEAEMVDYCRTKFVTSADIPNTITCSMYDKVALTMPFSTPWRVIMIAEKAPQLLQNNDLILNLNPPCAIPNTDWIVPGKIMREMSLSTTGAKALVDFAVRRHLQYIHFDAGWYGFEYTVSSDASAVNVDPRRNPRNDLDLQEVIRYAKQKGIGVFLYVNQRALVKQLDTLLPLYEKWGVAGLKFGFVHVGSHRWTTWLHDAIRKCAIHHLMVDIHDEYRPTGFSRTYPNLLTQEGVGGNEEMPDANHNTVLPFTRFLCGPADYTICYYHRPELKLRLKETQNARVLKTTAAHQLALAAVYYSPLQFLYWYDKPEDSQDEPELTFFDHIPTVWDDTKVLDGEIGKFVTVARESKGQWFVGSISNNDARDLSISFSFLQPGKKYKATVFYDDPASPVRTKVSMKQLTVTSSTVLRQHLMPSGGLAVWCKE
ncbi:MAG TPA: glycoside hydrolase family 97 N-terminal domain-containing protein [Chitinophaga sp.]|uniref:glycoside hydrolase family 97 protein n=1 Tax=Chitinophaga sp. TaxID=1869181 RepID=UPI002C7DA666|nr:glycoside hydrolase family 97 N-terminal domain-containing protein [Chitinophaga sp.]HVI43761.1 glycoside hydrolase family 97 N-terminal domain-containing protein [Chitinophaga sp.]